MKRLTRKQHFLLKTIVRGVVDIHGARIDNCDYRQILSSLPYKTSRESLMCSLRILERHGLIVRPGTEMRDGRARQVVEPTAVTIRMMTRSAGADEELAEYVEVSDEDSDIVILELE